MKIKNHYLSNLLKLTSSSVMAQLILIVSSPILTRLYTPEDFGIFALFIALVGILSTITNFRYEQAIIIPKSDNDSNQLIYLSLGINFLFSTFILIILFVCGENLFSIFNIQHLIKYYWLLPISIFFIGCFQVFNYWLIRNKKINKIAQIKVQQSILIVGIQFIFFKLGPIALILGHALGQLLGVLKNSLSFFSSTRINKNDMLKVAKEYKKFPLYSTWSALLNSTGAQLPVLIFTAYYSPLIAGLYMLTQRVIKTPLSIVGQAVTQLFISNIRNEEEKLKKNIININNFLTTLSLIPFAIIMVSGDKLFYLVFGSQWAEAGVVAAILSPWMFLVFICSPVSSLIEYKGKQKQFLIFQIILFISRIFSIFIGYILFENYIYMLILFSAVSTCIWLCFLSYIMHICNVRFMEWFSKISKKILIVFIGFFIFNFANIENNFLYWIFLSIISMVTLLLIFEKEVFINEN